MPKYNDNLLINYNDHRLFNSSPVEDKLGMRRCIPYTHMGTGDCSERVAVFDDTLIGVLCRNTVHISSIGKS